MDRCHGLNVVLILLARPDQYVPCRMTEIGGKSASENASVKDISLTQVMEHIRSGRDASGVPVRPYKWLEYTGRPKTSTELTVERVMEGCTFKSITSCIIGQL